MTPKEAAKMQLTIGTTFFVCSIPYLVIVVIISLFAFMPEYEKIKVQIFLLFAALFTHPIWASVWLTLGWVHFKKELFRRAKIDNLMAYLFLVVFGIFFCVCLVGVYGVKESTEMILRAII